MSEIIFYELPKLEKCFKDFLEGKIKYEQLPAEEKWCMFIKYQHEERAKSLIQRLCREEEGIMHAEKAITKISRSQIRYWRKMQKIKSEMDRNQELYDIKEQARKEGHEEGRKEGREEGRIKEREYFISLLDQGLSNKEIRQYLEKMSDYSSSINL